MNIFYLDVNVEACSVAMCDRHVCKMIIEYAQLLSTAHYILDGKQVGYKPTHKNHPCAVWVRKSVYNYVYLYDLFQRLCAEYTKRYGKVHKTAELLQVLNSAPHNMPLGEFTEPPQCLPDDCKCGNTVEAYRKYYINYKSKFAKWKLGAPHWWPLTEGTST